LNRRNFFIKSFAALLYLTTAGCAKASNFSLSQNKKNNYKKANKSIFFFNH